ncbi:hypothetical protein EU537_08735 [Candidatus Thorarchaeota archaeon]|nr:MAG: hypothetical protein EU537_08735 [Candidatus Thorarchaeota archaeon]
MTKNNGEITPEDEVRQHRIAVAEALFVTLLWSSSWVIIKFGLEELPPITFSGLRYLIASIILMTVILSQKKLRRALQGQSRKWWLTVTAYGLVFVAITQGAQFVGLDILNAITVSLLLNLTPILVLVLGAISLQEKPDAKQVAWILVGVIGVLIYFHPIDLPFDQLLGLAVVLVGVIANAASSIMGRAINRNRILPPIVITGVSITIGSLVLATVGLVLEGPTSVSPTSMAYLLWLGVVNTALAFTIWNKAMQTLRAIDVSIINGTMLPQIVILSIIFLNEMPTLLDYFGLILVGLSAFFVQWVRAKKLNSRQKIPIEGETI